ncbi:hypothetical protein C6499_21160 [Candidatus Poribacteria bacterium]|nr:MAG: hypothetical protein C6499_21160 [Candidatus Poribacteria bacterium]
MNWLTNHKRLSRLAETDETLTPSQLSARDVLLDTIHAEETRINLWGGPGTGKTFLAHYLHHRADVIYFSYQHHYDRRVSQHSVVAIDNAPYIRQEARGLYDSIRWGDKDYKGPKVILITRKPIADAVRRIELTLTDTDIVHIENIIRQQFGESDFESFSQYDRQPSGLWWYVKNLCCSIDC